MPFEEIATELLPELLEGDVDGCQQGSLVLQLRLELVQKRPDRGLQREVLQLLFLAFWHTPEANG